MHRVPASLLLALLCFGLALPFLQAQPDTTPACCRRDGKHHCAMPLNGDGFRTSSPACPYRHLSVLTSVSTALRVSSSVLSVSAHGQLRVRVALPVIALSSSDSTQKRGPPVS